MAIPPAPMRFNVDAKRLQHHPGDSDTCCRRTSFEAQPCLGMLRCTIDALLQSPKSEDSAGKLNNLTRYSASHWIVAFLPSGADV